MMKRKALFNIFYTIMLVLPCHETRKNDKHFLENDLNYSEQKVFQKILLEIFSEQF